MPVTAKLGSGKYVVCNSTLKFGAMMGALTLILLICVLGVTGYWVVSKVLVSM